MHALSIPAPLLLLFLPPLASYSMLFPTLATWDSNAQGVLGIYILKLTEPPWPGLNEGEQQSYSPLARNQKTNNRHTFIFLSHYILGLFLKLIYSQLDATSNIKEAGLWSKVLIL